MIISRNNVEKLRSNSVQLSGYGFGKSVNLLWTVQECVTWVKGGFKAIFGLVEGADSDQFFSSKGRGQLLIFSAEIVP